MPGSRSGVRRRVLSCPLFGLTLGALIAGHAQAAPVLPTGGKVAAGSAIIGAPGSGALTITQSSAKAIIDWSGFSIGAGGKVAFDNGSGATLNRVTGGTVSSLDGFLSATGSVYLVNPNGVIIGRNGVVNVGGSFVASTLDTPDASFLAGGPLGFTGASTAGVVNLGKVGALGGDVALIAAQVSNTGSVSAPQGSAGLLAGHSVLMLRDGALDQGRFSVLLGGAGTRVINTGLIAAADAELRAEGGNIYALAGDTAGVIRATGVKSGGGHVWLVAEGGELDLGGAISAAGAGATEGAIETSGGAVKIGGASIDAHGGRWLVDPYDLTIDATAASTIDQALNAGTSVTEQTTGTGAAGAGIAYAQGNGDITLTAPISWLSSAGLTLSAYRNVVVGATIASSGGGPVTLYADNTGTGVGTLQFRGGKVSTSGPVNIFYNPASNPAGGVVNTTSYINPTNDSSYVQGGGTLTSYMLVNTVYDLQNIQNNLSGDYALGQSIDASATLSWNGGAGFQPIGTTFGSGFNGALNGQGNTISKLTINRPNSTGFIGIFGFTGFGSIVQNLSLTDDSVKGAGYSGYGGQPQGAVGLLVGLNEGGLVFSITASATNVVSSAGELIGGIVGQNSSGTISNVTTAVSVSGGGYTGGVTGENFGTINNAYVSGKIIGNGQYDAGGVTGYNGGTVQNAYSNATVGGSAEFIGGIVGLNEGTVTDVYDTTVVAGNVAGQIAGANGSEGLLQNALWDREGAGQSSSTSCINGQCSTYQSGFGVGFNQGGGSAEEIGSATGLSPYAQSTYAGFDFSASGPWVIFEGSTRPLLRSEYSTNITNAHQLQLMALNLSATYTLAANVDASGTANPADVWGPAGFVPVGQASAPFTGVLNGAGHTVSGLTIAAPGAADVGLFGYLSGTAQAVTVSGTISGGTDVGTLAGYNAGLVSGASGKGTVSGSSQVGGLVGYNSGAIGASSGKAAVSSPLNAGSQMGGLAGFNTGQIATSYATGKVSGNRDVGGLVGLNSGPGSLSGDYASGAVSGASGKTAAGSGLAIGGLVGEDLGPILSSHATGAVTGYSDVGGLAGYTRDGAEVLNSYATGSVTGASGQNTPSGSGGSVGGLIGESAQAMGIDDSYATGAVSGVTSVGGLIGSHDGSGVLEQSYATGAVKGTSQVGGLVGFNNNEIVNSYATGAVSGSSGKGALVGVNGQSGLIGDSYATGKGGFGLVGVNEGSGDGGLYQDYFDEGSTGTSVGVGSGPGAGVTGIGGSTGLDPHQASTYAGFDFTNVWAIDPGTSRPYLIANPQTPPPS